MATGTKRKLAEAMSDAETFRALFAGCFERWEVAGSVRRGKPEVGDVEHVVVPLFGDVPIPGDLFGGTQRGNLLWQRLDNLIAAGELAKHVYVCHRADGTTADQNRWGDNYRGVDFRGFNHEIFCATEETWGNILTIRTGPAEFSQDMVTRMKSQGVYRCHEGKVIHQGSGQPIPCRTEVDFFQMCGLNFRPPEDRR